MECGLCAVGRGLRVLRLGGLGEGARDELRDSMGLGGSAMGKNEVGLMHSINSNKEADSDEG